TDEFASARVGGRFLPPHPGPLPRGEGESSPSRSTKRSVSTCPRAAWAVHWRVESVSNSVGSWPAPTETGANKRDFRITESDARCSLSPGERVRVRGKEA